MKDETIDILKFGASMAVFAVLIVYVVQSVLLGKQIQSKSIGLLTDMQISSESGILRELNDVETVMPAATCLSLLEYNYNYIGVITCYVCNTYGNEQAMERSFCIINHLKGNVRIYVAYDYGSGKYNITIKTL